MEKNLKLIVPKNFIEFGKKVNGHINLIRDTKENYIVDMDLVRFGNGEGKSVLSESVREQDVYIMKDLGNYDVTYEAYSKGGFDKIYSTNLTYVPDEYKNMPWFHSVDCSKKVANIISNLNESKSIKSLLNSKEQTAQKIKMLKR